MRLLFALALLVFSQSAKAEKAEITEAQPLLSQKDIIIVTPAGPMKPIVTEIAETQQQKEIGLMFREYLSPDAGMLFPFAEVGKEADHRMWMKNTKIPLDIIFLGADSTIKCIHKNAIPYDLTQIECSLPSNSVLELSAGTVERRKIKVGDKVVIK